MDISANLNNVRQRISAACARAGRLTESVTLVTVSKGHPAEVVRAAAELGLCVFGENRVQEARAKIGLCPGRVRWHLIGHLQSNKCRDAVHFFEMIQSVDSLALAEDINKCAEKSARTMPILLELNVAGESSKFGYTPEKLLAELPQLLEALHHAFVPIVVAGRAQFLGRASMTGQPDAAHAHAARSEPLAEVTHLVGRPGHAMNQSRADTGAGKEELGGVDAR